ncbi:MAG TPA: uracil-DNA glycosylase [Candidatus Paceibacterota bacterium]|nr:uracil-DNA glycosylase [Candidatus Paceibacterota bacterium]
MEVRIEPTWKDQLAGEFEQEYFRDLTAFVKNEYKDGTVYPAPKNIFRAFDLCPFDKVKVVIIGQDPYHGEGQANGLAFAVDRGLALPPSLRNIFKEIDSDLKGDRAASEEVARPGGRTGDLSRWASQGVLLLNATLTVRAHSAGSHQEKGWERFTDAVIRTLSAGREHLVFLLWGNYAKQKGAHIDRMKHLVLEAPHPSPFSADSGFFGCRHFSMANAYLDAHGKAPIDWL